MTTPIDNGGPAFPVNEANQEAYCSEGMTLRDYFAAKAMHALLREASSPDGNWHIEAAASYLIADAMLEARQS